MTEYKSLPKSDEESPDDNIKVPSTASSKGASQHKSEQHTLFETTVGWLCMVLAVVAGASVGPVFKFMMAEGIRPLLSASWRNQAMVLALLPFAVYEAWSRVENRVDWFSYKPDLPFPVFVHVLISGLSWSSNLLFWICGLQYITTFKASIVSSSHPVLLVIALRLKGHNVSLAEWIGVCVAFGGMFLSEYKPGHDDNAANEAPFHLQLVGYFMCLLSAAGEVITILNRIKTRKYVPLLQYTLATSFIVACSATILSLSIEGSLIFDSKHEGKICFGNDCLLGWTTPEWRWRMFFFGLWVGAVCITGFNYAMSYIPPLVFSSVTLVDPAVTATISWLCGIESLPGIFSWLGGGVVITGVAVIGYGERKRAAAEERESAHEECTASDDLEEAATPPVEDESGDSPMPSTTVTSVLPSRHKVACGLNSEERRQVAITSVAESRRGWMEVEMHPMRVVAAQA